MTSGGGTAGGADASAKDGTMSSGGSVGSIDASATGGATNSGGSMGSIDTSAAGGATGSGGTAGSIDASASGGATGSGGSSGSIDASATGGTTSSGGSSGSIDAPVTGDASSTGGRPSTGGTSSGGGAPGTGGLAITGGTHGTGGATATGGATTVPTCVAPTLDLAGGAYAHPVSATITCSSAGSVPYFTTDGSAPTTASTQGSTANLMSSGTLAAICAGAGCSPSVPVAATYAITLPTSGQWVTASGAPCVNRSAIVPDAAACEWQPCKDEPLPAVVYYVCDTGGDDTRSTATARSPATPWATVSRAVQQFGSLGAGEAIAFCRGGTFAGGGTYHNENGTQANPTIVRDYTRPGREGLGDARPIFSRQLEDYIEIGRVKFMNIAVNSGGQGVGAFTYDNLIGDVTFCNLELANADIGYELGGPVSVARIKVIGTRFINNANQGWLGSGQDLEVSNSYFYNNGYTNTMFNHSVYLGSPSAQDGFVLRGNEIHPPAATQGTAVVFHGVHTNVLIEGNLITWDIGQPQAGGWGIAQGCGGYSPNPSNGAYYTFRGNTVINAGNMSLGVGCCQHCVLENNLIINTQQATEALGAPQEEATGLTGYTPALLPSSDIIVRNNTVYLTKGGVGIRAGTEGAGYVVENNVVQTSDTCYQFGAGTFTSRDYNGSYQCSDAALGAHSWKSDPRWVAPGSDFRPASGSPLVGAGDPAQNPGIDLPGATRPSTPSIGAYEP